MKYIYKNISRAILYVGFLTFVISCEKDHDVSPYETAVDPEKAELKFIHTAIGPLGTNFSVNLFVNDVKNSAVGITSGLPLGIGYGGTYPSPINYSVIPSGAQTMKIVRPANATIPEATIITEPILTEAGKNHSSFLVGVSPNYSIFTVKDNLAVTNINETRAYIRFINLITNTPAAGYDLAIIRTTPATPTSPAITTTIKTFTAVGYKGGSPVFDPLVTIPIAENTADVYQLRIAGTTTVVATASILTRPGRVYTIFSRGLVGGLSNGLPSATVNIPVITFYTNL